jgi:hypothetical protein
MEPLWESAPSPPSAAITTTLAPGFAASVEFPDIEFLQGFGAQSGGLGLARDGMSGWYLRVYRRRVASGSVIQDSPDAYYLFTELALVNTLADTGVINPDVHRRLKSQHGYQAMQLYPRPDQAYKLEVRYVKRPEPLLDEYDVPTIAPDATNALVDLTAAYLYEAQGNWTGYKAALASYNAELAAINNRYADLRPPAVPIRRRLGRPVTMGRYRRFYQI